VVDLPVQPFRFKGGKLHLLDQRVLPWKKTWVKCQSARDVFLAIRQMVVRGAPVIGTVAAYGLFLEARKAKKEGQLTRQRIEKAARFLKSARPTAVNLSWALERSLQSLEGKEDMEQALFEEAQRQERENIAWTEKISRIGAEIIPHGARILTICNTGPLATGGYGTALGAMIFAWNQKKKIQIFACETRPYLQGARLTAWELKQLKIPVTLITDGMAAWTMEKKGIDLVLVGADRIALNGDTANKIGTLQLAILAHHFRIPFYPFAPLSSFDPHLASGEEISIEERNPREILFLGNSRIAPSGTEVFNPAFDVTPAKLITGIVTEEGLISPPFSESIPGALKKLP
jgi:methylthioribose-1-phosphate isomerase